MAEMLFSRTPLTALCLTLTLSSTIALADPESQSDRNQLPAQANAENFSTPGVTAIIALSVIVITTIRRQKNHQ